MSIEESYVIQNNKRLLANFSYQPRKLIDQKQEKELFTADDRKYLALLAAQPYKLMLKDVSARLDLSGSRGSKIKRKLERFGMMKVFQVYKGRGGKKGFPVLMPEGYKLLGMDPPKLDGKGAGHEHILYQHLIADHFDEFNSVIELIIDNKSIDVACEFSGKRIAIEVAMTAAHEKSNLEKDVLQANAALVIIACKDEKVKTQVSKEIPELSPEIRNKAVICRLSEVFKLNFEKLLNEMEATNGTKKQI